MRYNLAYILFILFLLSCGQIRQEKRLVETNKPTVDTIEKSDSVVKQDETSYISKDMDDHPYTENPIKVYLKNNKIYYDSISPYFVYNDIENLDELCSRLNELDSLPTVVFPSKAISIQNSTDTLFLSDFQFLVGNLKMPQESPKIIAFVDYLEDFGRSLLMVSIDEGPNVIDAEVLCSSMGDGGDFYRTEIEKVNDLQYNFITNNGYQTFTDPIDTIKYHKISGEIKINSDGTFTKQIIETDSNLIELIEKR